MVVVKEIGFPFVAGTGAGTLRDQGQGRLHIFLLDTTRTAAAATALTARGLLVVVVMVMLLLLWWLWMLQVMSITRRVRDGIG